MKNFSIILNVILLIAIAVLFYLYFSQKKDINLEKSDENSDTTQDIILSKMPHSPIVYINTDSLLLNYEFSKKLNESIEKKRIEKESQFNLKKKELENNYAEAEQKAPLMSESERQALGKVLMQKEQELYDLQQELTNDLLNEQQKLTAKLYDSIIAYLKRYNLDKNYQYILGYASGGGILLANDSLDITKSVIQGMNNEYQKWKK